MTDNYYNSPTQKVLKVIGIGGAGICAVNAMLKAMLPDVEYMVVAGNAQIMACSHANKKFSAGGIIDCEGPDGYAGNYQDIVRHINAGDTVVTVAGMGGSTGTKYAPLVSAMVKEVGTKVVGVVMMPFSREGDVIMAKANKGLEAMQSVCDDLVVIPNDLLHEMAEQGTGILDKFKIADNILRETIESVKLECGGTLFRSRYA